VCAVAFDVEIFEDEIVRYVVEAVPHERIVVGPYRHSAEIEPATGHPIEKRE